MLFSFFLNPLHFPPYLAKKPLRKRNEKGGNDGAESPCHHHCSPVCTVTANVSSSRHKATPGSRRPFPASCRRKGHFRAFGSLLVHFPSWLSRGVSECADHRQTAPSVRNRKSTDRLARITIIMQNKKPKLCFLFFWSLKHGGGGIKKKKRSVSKT